MLVCTGQDSVFRNMLHFGSQYVYVNSSNEDEIEEITYDDVIPDVRSYTAVNRHMQHAATPKYAKKSDRLNLKTQKLDDGEVRCQFSLTLVHYAS